MKTLQRILEPDENEVHLASPPMLDQVTLCGITDWIGRGTGSDTDEPLSCWACAQIWKFCNSGKLPPTTGRAK